MTDPAGITQRGAEQSAPRSRCGLSAPEVHGVSRLRAHVVATDGDQPSVLAFDGEPPGAWRQLERGQIGPKLGAYNRFAARASSAVERRAEARRRLGIPRPRIGRIGAQLCTQRSSAATSTVACLTSASSGSNARHVGVVPLAVLGRATIPAGEASGLPVERIARAGKCGVE